MDLRDVKIRHVTPRESEPSSLASTATHTYVDSQIPSELSSNYVMNWVEALVTIDCLMLGVEMPLEEMDRMPKTRCLEEIPLPETPEEMLKIFKDDELKKEQKEEGILHLSYLAEVESLEEAILRKEEAKEKHNVPKIRESNGVLTKYQSEEELKAKLLEGADQEPIPWRDVHQYFKDYTMDEVVIVMPQAVRPSQANEKPSMDGVYDGSARTREINLAQEGDTNKPIHIGEHLTEEESEQLKHLLVNFKDYFAWSYEYLKGIDENIVVHTIPLRANTVLVTQRPYRTNPWIAQTIQ